MDLGKSQNTSVRIIWKEASVAHFKVLSRHLPGGTEEYHEKTSFRIAGLRTGF
jgi:hypothetical protein